MKRSIALLITGALLFATGATLNAADARTAEVTAPSSPEKLFPDSEIWLMSLDEIDFLEMPLYDITDFLRAQFPGLNIIILDEVMDVEVRLRLVNVTLQDIILGIELATDGLVTVEPVNERLLRFALSPDATAATAQRQSQPLTRVFNLSSYLEGKAEADRERALQDLEHVVATAWEATEAINDSIPGRHGKRLPSVKIPTATHFHSGTQLLIVVGPEEFVQLYEMIVAELTGGKSPVTYSSGMPRQQRGLGGGSSRFGRGIGPGGTGFRPTQPSSGQDPFTANPPPKRPETLPGGGRR